MKQIPIRKLENEVAKNKIVIAHFGSSRCVPCRDQEKKIAKVCSKYPKQVACYSIDIDNGKKGYNTLKDIGITKPPVIIPTTMIYVNGKPQNFKDTTFLDGRVVDRLYGERDNIESAIQNIIKKLKFN
jgi:thiol-disulfide isomerase/thioredoxin